MGEKFLLTPENYESYLKEKEIFSFEAKLNIKEFEALPPMRLFKAQKAMRIEKESEEVDGKPIICDVKKGEFIVCSSYGQLTSITCTYFKKHFDIVPPSLLVIGSPCARLWEASQIF